MVCVQACTCGCMHTHLIVCIYVCHVCASWPCRLEQGVGSLGIGVTDGC